MNKINDNIVDIKYQQTGTSSNTNELGMREMLTKPATIVFCLSRRHLHLARVAP